MGRLDWSAIRLVAESISYGGRSRWNMLKIPELTFGQAREAISELERNGMVSVTDDRVEPTEAFSSWFVDLRRREDARTTRGPVEQPAAVSQQAIPSGDTPATRTLGGIRKKPSTGALAVRLLEKLAGRRLKYFDVGRPISGEMSMGQLRRALNAYRMGNWDNALELCKRSGAISIDQDGTVKLLVVPARLFPAPPPAPRKSAGRNRSEEDKAARRAWVIKKRLENGEDLEEIEDDEPRDDVKEWLASLQMQGNKS
jgi:hypothetical protein